MAESDGLFSDPVVHMAVGDVDTGMAESRYFDVDENFVGFGGWGGDGDELEAGCGGGPLIGFHF